jgi:hypothetical protein
MSNPQKRWSFGMALGRGVGSAIGAGGAATVATVATVVRSGGLDPYIVGAIGVGGGFVGGFLGTALGYWWDESPEVSDFWGEALMAMVPTGLFAGVAYLAAAYALFPSRPPEFAAPWYLRLALVGGLFGFLGGAAPSAADTLLARYRGQIPVRY